MTTNPYESPETSASLPAAAKPSPLRILFWVGYGLLSPAPITLAMLCLGNSSGGEILVQAFAVIWVVVAVLAIARVPLATVMALSLVAVPWCALLTQTTRRLFHFVTIGMEAADGTGSPALFLFNAVVELALFLPLTIVVLLGALSLVKRRGRAARVDSE